MQNFEKNARIRQRRKSQEAKVYELKLDKSRISKGKLHRCYPLLCYVC